MMETAEKKKQPSYMLIWFVLLVLTIVEVGVAYVSSLPRNVLIVVLVGLAVWKATLVAMYYMHLKFERLRLILLATAPLPLAIILVVAILLEQMFVAGVAVRPFPAGDFHEVAAEFLLALIERTLTDSAPPSVRFTRMDRRVVDFEGRLVTALLDVFLIHLERIET